MLPSIFVLQLLEFGIERWAKKSRGFVISKYRIPILLIAILVLLISIFSWLNFPGWHTAPLGFVGLLVTTTIGVVGTLAALFSLLRNFSLITDKKRKEDNELNKISQFGNENVIVSGENKKVFVGTTILRAETVNIFGAAGPNGLFLQTTSPPSDLPDYFVEREKLIEELRLKLAGGERKRQRRPHSVHLAIVGIGGSGKTLIVKSFLKHQYDLGYFSDKILLFENVGSIGREKESTDAIFSDWLIRLGEDPQKYPELKTKMRALENKLQNESSVIVLDDVWEAEFVKDVLSFCGRNCILIITTRDPELIARLGGFDQLIVGSLEENEARALIENRLNKKIDQMDWESYVKPLIKELGGNALAISLVASRISFGDISLEGMLEKLRGKKGLETIDIFDSEVKDESIIASLRISTENLKPDMLENFASLGVLAEGEYFFVEDAAMMFPKFATSNHAELEKVDSSFFNKTLSGESREKAEDILANFYRKGLLEFQVLDEDIKNYRMHPLLHKFAKHLLKESNQLDKTEAYHLYIYSLILVNKYETDESKKRVVTITFPQFWLALNRAWKRIDAGHLSEFVRIEDAEDFFRYLLAYLGNYWTRNGQMEEVIKWYGRGLGISQKNNISTDQAFYLMEMGNANKALGKYKEAEDCFSAAKEIADELGDQKILISALNGLGGVYLEQFKPEVALPVLERAVSLSREIKDQDLLGRSLGNFGQAKLLVDQYDESIRLIEEALEISKQTGDSEDYAKRQGNLGYSYYRKGLEYLEKASSHVERSLDVAKYVGEPNTKAREMWRLGEIHYSLGHTNLARIYAEESFKLLKETNARELTIVDHLLKRIQGALPDPVTRFSPPQLFRLTGEACMGDRIAYEKIRPYFEKAIFIPEAPDYSRIVLKLKQIFEGERDIDKLTEGVDEWTKINIESLLLHIADPQKAQFVHLVSVLVADFVSGEKDSASNLEKFLNHLKNPSIYLTLDRNSLVLFIEQLIAGERNSAKLLLILEDEILKTPMKLSLQGHKPEPTYL